MIPPLWEAVNLVLLYPINHVINILNVTVAKVEAPLV